MFSRKYGRPKKMCKEIKETFSINNSNHTFPTTLTVNNETITNPSDIAILLINFCSH